MQRSPTPSLGRVTVRVRVRVPSCSRAAPELADEDGAQRTAEEATSMGTGEYPHGYDGYW